MYAKRKSSNQPDARALPCALRAARQSTFPSQILDLTFLTLRFQPRPRHPRDPRSTSCMTHFRKNTSVYIKTHSLRAHVRLTQFSRASWHPWLHRPARPVSCRLFFCKSLQSFFSLLQVTAFTIFTPKKIASSILPSFSRLVSIRVNSRFPKPATPRHFHAWKTRQSAVYNLHSAFTKGLLYRGFLHCTAKRYFFIPNPPARTLQPLTCHFEPHPQPHPQSTFAPFCRTPHRPPPSTRLFSRPASTTVPRSSFMQLSNDQIRRYSRHLILPEVGLAGQKKICSTSVLCIGAGGLGSPIAMYLAAAGVGKIGLVDFDTVDFSNLQRQIIHATDDVGRLKTASAQETIQGINPNTEVVCHNVRISSENALDIIRQYDVVVDGTDNFPTRYLTNDACVLLKKANAYGSI